MNPKKALFLSTVLTTFVIAILFGVYSKITKTSTQVASLTAPVALADNTAASVAEQPTSVPSAAAPTIVTPDLAASLAARAINRQDVYSVETSSYLGVDAFKVVFSSGDVVYIGLDQQVFATEKLQPVIVTVANVAPAPAPKKHRAAAQAPTTGSSGGGEIEHETE